MIQFALEIVVFINLYVILGVSFNLLVGYSGLFSMSHAAFYGIGAYASALLAMRLGMPFLLAALLGMLIAAAVSVPLAIPSLRVSGDYLVIASLGFQIILSSVFLNLDITGGAAGLPRIPPPAILGQTVRSAPGFVVFTLAFAALAVFFSYRLTSSPFGRVLRAMRDDEVAIQGLGKNIYATKVVVFAIAGAMAALAGALYGSYVGFISPPSFAVEESVFIFSLVIIGGAGTLMGSVAGAIVLEGLPELLRFVHLPYGTEAPLRQIIYAALLIAFMLFRPQGLFGQYARGSTLVEDE